MPISISPVLATNISTDTTILTTAGVFYGFAIIPATTAACKAIAYDAKATAAGTAIFISSVASTAGIGNNPFIIQCGVQCRTGLHIDVTCTSGADQVIVFYGKV
jgi:hypothetical protein